jgi:hypothetical protein
LLKQVIANNVSIDSSILPLSTPSTSVKAPVISALIPAEDSLTSTIVKAQDLQKQLEAVTPATAVKDLLDYSKPKII